MFEEPFYAERKPGLDYASTIPDHFAGLRVPLKLLGLLR